MPTPAASLHPFVYLVIQRVARRELPFYAEVPTEFVGAALLTVAWRRLPFGKQVA